MLSIWASADTTLSCIGRPVHATAVCRNYHGRRMRHQRHASACDVVVLLLVGSGVGVRMAS
jgi:hypothetical protein